MMTAGAGELIVLADFPELRLLAWSRDPVRPIPASEVFELYERNWRFVDPGKLGDREAALIERRKRRYGRGVLLGA